MSHNLNDNMSTLVQVEQVCSHAATYDLNQYEDQEDRIC